MEIELHRSATCSPDFDEWFFSSNCDLWFPNSSNDSGSSHEFDFGAIHTNDADSSSCCSDLSDLTSVTYSIGSKSKRSAKESQIAAKSVNQLEVIAATDIRRSLAVLFTDAVNEGNDEELVSLLLAHCRDDITMMVQHIGRNDLCTVSSRDAVVAYVLAMQEAVPDGLVELITTRLEAVSTGESTVTCNVVYSGTKILDLFGDSGLVAVISPNTSQEIAFQAPIDKCHTMRMPMSAGLWSNTAARTTVVEELIDGVRAQPIVFSSPAQFTLYIDQNKKIFNMAVVLPSF